MKITRITIWTTLTALFMCGYAFAQETGDYRSVATGNWSDNSTWEIFNGETWVSPDGSPEGDETITIYSTDTVRVDAEVTITGSGYIVVSDTAVLEVTTGSLEFDGGTYEHARDEGSIPTATWGTGSTALITGITGTAPGNRGQDYYNLTFNTPGLVSNRDMNLAGRTISGAITVINTGSARWQLVGGQSGTVTIIGDLIIQDGQFATQGTGSATNIVVDHYGDINVSGGNFSISRGSQGSGTGTTTWNLLGGNFDMMDATTQNSNPTPGNAKFVFAGSETQSLTFDSVTYSGTVHFKVADSSTVEINDGFEVNGLFINEGAVTPLGTLTFLDGSTYEHARDGGDVPSATWATGSTALFTGIRTSAPGNRGQDYYNLTFATDSLTSNRDMDLDGYTIGGDITVVSTGSARWQLVGGSSGTVTIMGDVTMQAGQFATQGTGSATDVVVDHYGDINVTGGNFSIGRGSQGSGTGTTRWYLHEGNFSMSDATTQNSNSAGATFVFSAENAMQYLSLSNVSYGGGGLPIEVDSLATLVLDTTTIEGNGKFELTAGATLATMNAGGIDSVLQTTGNIIFSRQANFTFNGSEAQVPGSLLPDTLGTLTIDNTAGVSVNDTLLSNELVVTATALLNVDTAGSITASGGTIGGTIVNRGALEAAGNLVFENGSVYEHARNEGSIPSGTWNEGSTLLITGTTGNAPGNRNQNYYNITLNTPDLVSNVDLGLNDVTIGGDIHVINTGVSRWRLTSASGGDSAIFSIMGDIIVEGGSFETQGTGNALTVFEVHHYGDVNVTGGNFSVARGSQGSGSGSTRWFMHEGNFSIQDATTQNSNAANAWFVFDKDTVQTITLSNVTYGGGGLAIEVASGSMLDFGMNELGGSGLFVLNEDASLLTAHAGGIDSTIQSTGNVMLSTGANFIFNGSTSQVTGLAMPDTVNNLVINNAAGVVLSQETLINGTLRLMAGEFDNTIAFTLGESGSISYEGGSLTHPIVSVEGPLELPKVFALNQNYPNPFNPATTISYDVPRQAQVTLKVYDVAGREVTELVNGQHSPGSYNIQWNASGYASGLYYFRIEAGDFVAVRKLVLLK